MTPKYQHRHYEQFAAILRDMHASGLCHDTYLQEFTDKLLATFTRDNPRFQPARFLAACSAAPTAKQTRIR